VKKRRKRKPPSPPVKRRKKKAPAQKRKPSAHPRHRPAKPASRKRRAPVRPAARSKRKKAVKAKAKPVKPKPKARPKAKPKPKKRPEKLPLPKKSRSPVKKPARKGLIEVLKNWGVSAWRPIEQVQKAPAIKFKGRKPSKPKPKRTIYQQKKAGFRELVMAAALENVYVKSGDFVNLRFGENGELFANRKRDGKLFRFYSKQRPGQKLYVLFIEASQLIGFDPGEFEDLYGDIDVRNPEPTIELAFPE
jgi:hypothetical protein